MRAAVKERPARRYTRGEGGSRAAEATKRRNAPFTNHAQGEALHANEGKGEREAVVSTDACWVVGGGMGGRRGRKRKRRPDMCVMSELYENAEELMRNAYAATSMRTVRTAMRAFFEYEEVMRQDRPIMFKKPKTYGDMNASLHNELSLVLFAAWLQWHGLAVSSICTYLSLAKSNLSLGLGWALTMRDTEMRLPRMLKGLRRAHKKVRRKRLGWRARYEGVLRGKMGAPVGLDACTQVAIRCTLRQGLLRAADALPEKALDVTRNSTLQDAQLFTHEQARYIRLTVLPAKKNEQQGKTEFVYLPEGNGVTDAYSAIRAMLAARFEAFGEEPGTAPLFKWASGKEATIGHARKLFKVSGGMIGLDKGELGAQSGRIGGATDLFSADATPALLQINGRWVRAATAHQHTRARTPAARHTQPTTLGGDTGG